MFFFTVYVSSATSLFSRPDLDELLRVSVKNNSLVGISGMLLYKDGNFMQILEGPESAVNALYTKIDQDPRHHGVIPMWSGEQETRQFPGWTMAFRDLNSASVQATPGYSQFLNTPLTSTDLVEPHGCMRLLTVFKQSM